MKLLPKGLRGAIALSVLTLLSVVLVRPAAAQDDQEDPPSRVARLGYLQGSVSFQPAGESDWVDAVQNRPMTTGDQLWADQDSHAEVSLGSAVIYLNNSTGISFLNLDDRTAQIQLSSGSINVRVRHLNRDDDFEIDTPNQAFTIFQPGRYRVEASEDGSYTVVSIREGEGESTGNGQTFTLRAGQRATFDGTDTLNAQVEDLGGPDDFDNWSDGRYQRFENSRSARYVSQDMVGYEDLDDNGDWRPDPTYGNVWYPHESAGWAPYREGHWAWVDPWGWTWVDDEPWGYAPFHYGRWLAVQGRWGWVPGPVAVAPVYAPALVVFIGGGGGFGGNMGWFPLGPREVYVPSYGVSRAYVERVNVSNTTVSTTTVTNIYNTTIVNKTTVINNVTYANRNVSGAVTAVPQQAFTSGQPVGRAAVTVNAREIASAPVNARASVAPTQNSVYGSHANTANHVKAPPAAVMSRPIVAKAKVPPPPVPFAARQQALAAHPGQPIARQEMQHLQAANHTAPAGRPAVKQAPPGKPATATAVKPGTPPPGRPAGNQPASRSGGPPAANERPAGNAAQPNRPNNQPEPNNRPAAAQPNNRPAEPSARTDRTPAAQPNNRPEPNRPSQPAPENRPTEPPARTDRPPAAQPNNRPEPSRTEPNRPEPNRAEPNRPAPAQPANRPEPARPETGRPAETPANRPAQPPPQHNAPAARPATPPPSERPQQRTPPPPAKAQPAKPAPHPQTPEEKKKEEEKKPQ